MPKGDGQSRLPNPLRKSHGTSRRVGRPLDPPRKKSTVIYGPSLKHPALQLKACPRCTGDLISTSDYYGPEVYCAQCGYRVVDRKQIEEETARLNKLHRAMERRVINGVRMEM